MTDRHVLDRLPLWVGGDLDPQEMAAVDAHLAACPNCRAAAEAFRQSRVWLTADEGIPFGAGDRAALRAEVMARLRAHPQRASLRSWIRPALALAAAALLLGIVLPALRRPPSVGAAPRTAAARPDAGPAGPSTPTSPDPRPRATPAASLMAPSRARRPRDPLPLNALPDPDAPPQDGPARIELQTSNPNVRIIWLARTQAPSDDLAPPSTPF